MGERHLQGIYGIVLTPFMENGAVDYGVLARQTEKMASSADLAGLVVCGSTGEFTRLSFEENVRLMQVTKEAAAGRTQVICGATAGDSYTACKYVQEIEKLGADGILLAPPYYFTLNEQEILAYYEMVMESNEAGIPVVGYNIPQCTNKISLSLFEKLLSFDCVKGFKNSWNDLQEITQQIALRNRLRPDVSFFTGLDACLFGTLGLGGDGVFSAISYLMPDVMAYIRSNHRCGALDKALAVQGELLRLINIVNRFTFPYGYRLLSEAADMPLGAGRAAVPASVTAGSRAAAEEMRTVIAELRSLMERLG